ncbi:hypothetical protein AMAG_12835 [Allomyces macrogynus ATCC 38327]|uniref:Uncharacterized protein n=1 Tax=Allomyces macrogynus (strain ATCC 38327) TaxID=578462 RepID=A0A0L0T1Q5_ALLM3|nr:hypothetical protein AMAG_12835 [Allomyces macrogynus ATCC 38327]|eukprot:KNE68667.1 hypothetical protein AMAG_12835 [Allomyces macrogynus ATCC 38327]
MTPVTTLKASRKTPAAQCALLAFFFVLALQIVSTAEAGWPQGMLGATLMSPGLVYLPKEKKAYIFGGKLWADGKAKDRITDVAVIDLSQPIKGNDIQSPAVSSAPFKLPHRSWRQPILVIDNGNGVYETRIYTYGDEADSFRTVWRIPNLLDPKAAAASEPSSFPLPEVYFPAWSTVSTPQTPSEQPAVYFFGNTTANGSSASKAGNDTLYQFKKDGIIPAQVESKTRPPGSGWGVMTQDGKKVVLIKRNEVWTYNQVGSVWIPRDRGLNQGRSDAAAVVFKTSTRSFVIVVGGSTQVEYFDLDSPTSSMSVMISGDGPPEYSGALSVFVHDSHLFLVGGIVASSTSNANTPLNIVRIDSVSGGNALEFTYVPTYTPSASGLSTGAIVGIVVAVVAVLLAIAGVIYLCRRRRMADRLLIPDWPPGPPQPSLERPILQVPDRDAGQPQIRVISRQEPLVHPESVDEILATNVCVHHDSDQDPRNVAPASASLDRLL